MSETVILNPQASTALRRTVRNVLSFLHSDTEKDIVIAMVNLAFDEGRSMGIAKNECDALR